MTDESRPDEEIKRLLEAAGLGEDRATSFGAQLAVDEVMRREAFLISSVAAKLGWNLDAAPAVRLLMLLTLWRATATGAPGDDPERTAQELTESVSRLLALEDQGFFEKPEAEWDRAHEEAGG